MRAIPNETLFYVTAGMLRRRHACDSQLALFNETFGGKKRVYLTLDNFRRALESGLYVSWLCWRMQGRLTSRMDYRKHSAIEHRAGRLTDAIYELAGFDNRLLPDKEKELVRAYRQMVKFAALLTAHRD